MKRYNQRKYYIRKILASVLVLGVFGTSVLGEVGTIQAQAVQENVQSEDSTLKTKGVTEHQMYETPEVLMEVSSVIQAEQILKNQSCSGIAGTFEAVTDSTVLYRAETMEALWKVLDVLEQSGEITYYQPNYKVTINQLPSDPYYSKQWGLSNDGTFLPETSEYQNYTKYQALSDVDMNVPEGWEVLNEKQKNGEKKQVVVAIIDAGVDINHEDLSNVIWTNPNEVLDGIDNDGDGRVDDIHGWNFYSNSANVYESSIDDAHGTHVAGIIVAEQNSVGVAGVASAADVKIMPVKCLGGKDGNGNLNSILQGIHYAQEHGADIVNMSLGIEAGPVSEENRLFTQEIRSSDMLFVTAAGNGDDRTGIGYDITRRQVYPACVDSDNVIAVGNVRWDGRLDDSSNYSTAYVDVAAPGMAIYSTLPQNQYGYMSGTSMAAPMVTGVAAMVMANYDKLSASDVRKIINATVKKDSALDGKILTGGIPDLYEALHSEDAKKLAEKTPPVITLSEGYIDEDSYMKALNIVVTDEQNDIVAICGDYGVLPVEYFEGGNKGTVISNESAGTMGHIPFNVDTSYTIYAKDKSGFETVQSYQITISTVQTKVTGKTIKTGQKYQLKPSVNTQENAGYTFTSSNPKVATVNSKGVVKAKKKGWTKITIHSPHAKDAEVYIKVKKSKK